MKIYKKTYENKLVKDSLPETDYYTMPKIAVESLELIGETEQIPDYVAYNGHYYTAKSVYSTETNEFYLLLDQKQK